MIESITRGIKATTFAAVLGIGLITGAKYKPVLLDPVEFYPPPQPSETVPESTLKDLQTCIDGEMRKAISRVAPPATAAGPGVVRIREAITAVDKESDFKSPTSLSPSHWPPPRRSQPPASRRST